MEITIEATPLQSKPIKDRTKGAGPSLALQSSAVKAWSTSPCDNPFVVEI